MTARQGARSGPRLSRQEARALADRILGISEAEGTSVHLDAAWRGHSRYAVNRIITAGEEESVTATIRARLGRREASVSTNRLDEASLREAAERAASLARLSPEDPELMPLLGPQTYREGTGWFESVAVLDADARARAAADAIRRAGDDRLQVAGFLDARAGASAVANSSGLFAWHAASEVDYSLTVRTVDGSGSGWAGAGHRDWAAVDVEGLHARAVDKALRSRDPRPLEPGRYAVVFEPQAVADLVGLLAGALWARPADEGRSAFSAPDGNRIGERIVDARVTLRSDPAGLGSPPFDEEGLPLGPVTWIEGGVLRALAYDRFWAGERGVEPTGPPGSLRMSGDETSSEELVRGMERGLLVTRLWYIRQVDPRTILYTGLTRDGTFLVEGGEVAGPVNNFRWNDSPLAALSRLEALSWPVRVSPTREVPAIRVSEFHFTSVSEAV